MVTYRRNFIPGATYFFTVTLHNRKSTLLIDSIDLLKASINSVKQTYPFIILAYVVLPDHLHILWKLPANDTNYSHRWKLIKALFSKGIKKSGYQVKQSRHNELNVWQRRFWEHTIRDEKDLANHIHYIHYNPIKHQLVQQLNDWPFSSFHHFVKQGKLPADWGRSISPLDVINLYSD